VGPKGGRCKQLYLELLKSVKIKKKYFSTRKFNKFFESLKKISWLDFPLDLALICQTEKKL